MRATGFFSLQLFLRKKSEPSPALLTTRPLNFQPLSKISFSQSFFRLWTIFSISTYLLSLAHSNSSFNSAFCPLLPLLVDINVPPLIDYPIPLFVPQGFAPTFYAFLSMTFLYTSVQDPPRPKWKEFFLSNMFHQLPNLAVKLQPTLLFPKFPKQHLKKITVLLSEVSFIRQVGFSDVQETDAQKQQ